MTLIKYIKQKRIITIDDKVIARLNENESNIFLELASTSEVVTRQHLLDAGWPDTIVSSNSVNMAVRSIRSSTGLHDLILTAQGVGYSFNAEKYSIEFQIEAEAEQASITSSLQHKAKTKRCFTCYFIITIIIVIYFLIEFNSPNESCAILNSAKVCSASRLTEKDITDLKYKFETIPGKNYYYGKLNAYKEYVLIELE